VVDVGASAATFAHDTLIGAQVGVLAATTGFGGVLGAGGGGAWMGGLGAGATHADVNANATTQRDILEV